MSNTLPQFSIYGLIIAYRFPSYVKSKRALEENTRKASPDSFRADHDVPMSEVTEKDLYRAQTVWDRDGLLRLEVDRRVELCEALDKLVTKLSPSGLKGGASHSYWKMVSQDPDVVNYQSTDY